MHLMIKEEVKFGNERARKWQRERRKGGGVQWHGLRHLLSLLSAIRTLVTIPPTFLMA
jgi:hypothetical protein